MNINTVKNINFGSIKLFRAQLTKEDILGEKKPLKAYISLLEKSDLNRLDLQDDVWLDDYGYRTIGNDIIWDMKCKKKNPYWDDLYFFAVECPEEPKGEKIKAIMEAIKCDKCIKLSLLQSKSSMENPTEKTFGAGTCLIYMLTKLANKLKKDKIKVVSLDDHSTHFYQKLGFEQDTGRIYIMNSQAISENQKKLEEQFSISPVRLKKHPFA